MGIMQSDKRGPKRTNPDYEEGFFDALERRGMRDSTTPEYCSGFFSYVINGKSQSRAYWYDSYDRPIPSS